MTRPLDLILETQPLSQIPGAFFFQLKSNPLRGYPSNVFLTGVSSEQQLLDFCAQRTPWPSPLTLPGCPHAQLCFLPPSDIHSYIHEGYLDMHSRSSQPSAGDPYWVVSTPDSFRLLYPNGDRVPTPIEVGSYPHEITSLEYNLEALLEHLEVGKLLNAITLHQPWFDASPIAPHPTGAHSLQFTFFPSVADMQHLHRLGLAREASGLPYGSDAELLLQSDILQLKDYRKEPPGTV